MARDSAGTSPRAKDIVESLDLDGRPDAVAGHVVTVLAGSRQLEDGEDSLVLFLRAVTLKVPDEDGMKIVEIIERSRLLPPQPQVQPPQAPGDFDPSSRTSKRQSEPISTRSRTVTFSMRTSNGSLDPHLVSTELGCDNSQPCRDLSEQIPDFLTARCAKEDLMSLVRVFRVLHGQQKEEQAQRVAEIVDRMLPLLPAPAHSQRGMAAAPGSPGGGDPERRGKKGGSGTRRGRALPQAGQVQEAFAPSRPASNSFPSKIPSAIPNETRSRPSRISSSRLITPMQQ